MARVEVRGPRPYLLFLTHGLSDRVSPGASSYAHELSVAVPTDARAADIWGSALLRHLARYVLTSGAELRVGDTLELGGAVSRVPFPLAFQADFPDSELRTVLVASDPLLGTVDTPAGPVEVRRICALHADETALVEVWSAASLVEEATALDPALRVDLQRASLLSDPAFRARCEGRAQAEGGMLGQMFVEGCGWHREGDDVVLQLPRWT